MRLKTILTVCMKLLYSKERENPGGAFKTPHGDIPYGEASSELKRVRDWACPGLQTGDIQLIVHCKDCRHYRKYRKRNSAKPIIKRICEVDGIERSPDFFCKNGDREERLYGKQSSD